MVNLTYRGVKYSADEPLVHPAQTAPEVLHEDPSPNFARTGYLPAPQPVNRLTYRGVSYQQPAVAIREEHLPQRESVRVGCAVPTPAVSQMGQSLTNTRFVEPSQRRSVLEYLQTRLKAAKAQGDRALVGLLQQEIQLLF
jgi:hypothetical protein